ncbi:MAG: type II secretion system protein GspD, partial [Dokdonella sp.]
LIQDNRIDNNTGLPFISKVPVLRHLFGTSKQQKNRTELIVLITPRVIGTVEEGRQATEDYSRQFESLAPLQAKARTAIPQTAPAPAQPVQTYPIPETVKPQEELPRDH